MQELENERFQDSIPCGTLVSRPRSMDFQPRVRIVRKRPIQNHPPPPPSPTVSPPLPSLVPPVVSSDPLLDTNIQPSIPPRYLHNLLPPIAYSPAYDPHISLEASSFSVLDQNDSFGSLLPSSQNKSVLEELFGISDFDSPVLNQITNDGD